MTKKEKKIPPVLRKEKAASFYRQVYADPSARHNFPEAMHRLRQLIINGDTLLDENGSSINDKNKNKVIVRLSRFLLSSTEEEITPEMKSEMLFQLAEKTARGEINEDELGRPIPVAKRSEKAAELYRQSGNAESLILLAHMLFNEEIITDEKGVAVPVGTHKAKAFEMISGLDTQGARIMRASFWEQSGEYEKAAREYLKIGDVGRVCFAKLLANGKIDFDESDNYVSPEDSMETAAAIYRQVGDPDALFELALMIDAEKITLDEAGALVSSEDKENVVARLCRASNTDNALFLLTLKIYARETSQDECGSSLRSNHERLNAIQRLTLKLIKKNYGGKKLCYGILGHAHLKMGKNEKQALKFFTEAAALGDLEALDYVSMLKEKTERGYVRTFEDEKEASDFLEDMSGSDEESPVFAKGGAGGSSAVVVKVSYSKAKVTTTDAVASTDDLEHKEKIAAEIAAEMELVRHKKAMEKEQLRANWENKRKEAALKMQSDKLFVDPMQFVQNLTPPMDEYWMPEALEGRLCLPGMYDERINSLIVGIQNNDRRGQPEILQGDEWPEGTMSRRITKKHRLVYVVEKTESNNMLIRIIGCGSHYNRK